MVKKKMSDQDVDIEGFELGADDSLQEDGGEGGVNVADASQAEGDKASEVAGVQEWKDKYLRLSAEFDNFRRRTLKEKMEIAAAGGEGVMKVMLPVLDDIDRALDAMRKTEDIEAVRSGIELISQKLSDVLRSKGLDEIEALGQELDTDFHEAVAKFGAGPDQKGKIIDVAQKGYKLNDKVIRHSKVVVGE